MQSDLYRTELFCSILCFFELHETQPWKVCLTNAGYEILASCNQTSFHGARYGMAARHLLTSLHPSSNPTINLTCTPRHHKVTQASALSTRAFSTAPILLSVLEPPRLPLVRHNISQPANNVAYMDDLLYAGKAVQQASIYGF